MIKRGGLTFHQKGELVSVYLGDPDPTVDGGEAEFILEIDMFYLPALISGLSACHRLHHPKKKGH